MIYTDGIHICSDTSVEELHAFMAKVRIKRCWYHHSRNHPHYDKPKGYSTDLLRGYGALLVRTRTLVKKCCTLTGKRDERKHPSGKQAH